MNADRVSVYAFTTHCRAAVPACSWAPMVGSAMVTAVASRKAMLEPSTVASRTQRPAGVP